MRVVVTGATGQVGIDLVRTWADSDDEVIGLGSADLDLTDRAAVHDTIRRLAPDVVINAAAWTAVDDCEADPDRAMAVNGLGVRWLAEAVADAEARLVQVSTDYVFDGTKTVPYVEDDPTNPASVYGQSKEMGEREAMALEGSAVIRTSWVCSAHRHNMVKTVLGLRHLDELRFVDDQRGCPTFTVDLAPTIRRIAIEGHDGVFHATNEGAVTWFEFVREILIAAGEDPGKVVAIRTADLDPPRAAPRPANSILDNRALRVVGLPPLPHYRRSLERTVAELLG